MYSSLFSMASTFSQGSMFNSSQSVYSQQNSAKRARIAKAAAEGGLPPSLSGNKVVAAQFNNGRGGELSWTKQNLHKAIRFKTGETPGPPAHDAYMAEAQLYTGQKVSTGFAFKAILDAQLVQGTNENNTRFFVHNCFRHTLSESCGIQLVSTYGPATLLWNHTLGPDGSWIRKDPANGGSCANPAPVVGAGFADDIHSAFRYPPQGTCMFSRMNRMNLENFMWNANPLKIPFINPGLGFALATSTLEVYDNGGVDPSGIVAESLPHQQIEQGVAAIPTPPATVSNTRGYYYKCQAKQGTVAYQFNNDGTSPLVIDVVITRIKKGHEIAAGNGCINTAYATGYSNYMNAANFQADYGGQPVNPYDCLNNARVEFMPAKALQWASVVAGVSGGDLVRPFKQVARDQFVVAGGGTRPWSMDLQSLDYNANDYSQNGPTDKNADDLTYIISLGFSTLAAPLGEFTASAMAVIDRVPQSVNCSVTGVYTENVLPVYLSKKTSTANVTGALDYTFYTTPEVTLPQLYGLDIANAGNIVRSNTQSSAYIQVGPTNILSGA